MHFGIKDVKKVLTVLSVGGITGILLLMLVYALPAGRMLTNARASIEIFEREGLTHQTIAGYEATTLDNYTDAGCYATPFMMEKNPFFRKA